MNATVTNLLTHPKAAARYLREAPLNLHRPSRESLRSGYQALSHLGAVSLDRLRDGSDHRTRVAALVGAGSAAVAAGTMYAVRHTGRAFADVLDDEQPYRVMSLLDLRDDEGALALIQSELFAEWGPFAPQDINEMRAMVRNAGRFVYVIRFYEDGELGPPSGVLQTARAAAGGEPDALRAAYPTFDAITVGGTWQASPAMSGDTAVLLQITAFGDRSRGVGSRLRDTALYMLPPSVRYALTTTPVPSDFGLDSDPESFGATRFHFRGGASPAGYAPGFKTPPPERESSAVGRQSNEDVVFMRYSRREDGEWEGVRRPALQIRRHEITLARAVRGWRPHLPSRQAMAA